MRAIQVSTYGGPGVLRPVELPDPTPGPGQVSVEMAYADVIFLDTLQRRGWGRDGIPRPLPYVPGTGGAGRVAETGPGVDPSWTGRRVALRTGTGYATRIVAELDQIVAVPDGLGLDVAAALTHDGVTAAGMAALGRPAAGERVLILAAAGGAGSVLVQLAAAAGAHVVAAASSPAKRELALKLGAASAVDYTRPGWEASVGGVDLAYDGAGGSLGTAAVGAIVDGGRFVTYGSANGFASPEPVRGIRVFTPLKDGPPAAHVVRERLESVLGMAAAGRLQAAISVVYPLAEAAAAHRALADRTTVGKSLLRT